ncbi:MAG TPA: hypothetical protein VFV15_08035 [Moraxellaceae bacterium]|nr:hypothetical protein [Moraxellaceae bacterium]
MTRIVFRSTQLSVRGTEVALFDYAQFNESLLGNESLILFDETSPLNDPAVIRRFEQRFPVHAYRKGQDIDAALAPLNADLTYFIKLDRHNYHLSALVPTLVHEVFPVKPALFHGSAYAFVSGWLSRTFANGRVPAVPHIVTLPEVEGDLRAELGIPADATVFGCHGGKECFDIGFAQAVVGEVLAAREDIHFVFLNINPFLAHPRARFLPGTADVERKVRFIQTCDAMLHARSRGETFGLAVAEFSLRNKPVMTYFLSGERNHIDTLGERGLYYRGPAGLRALLLGFDREAAAGADWDCHSRDFSPAAVMPLFDRHLIQVARANGVGDSGDWSLGAGDRAAILAERAKIRAIKMARGLSRLLA